VVQRQALSQAPYDEYLQPETGLPHRVGQDELRSLLSEAGFRVRSIEREEHSTVHATPEASLSTRRRARSGTCSATCQKV
jgi:hypothetical protein